jgi:uncharacterized membrane protein YuzA (DUF378 family)
MLTAKTITAILLIVGGLNWGLIGFFQINLVAAIFGDGSGFSRAIYSLVGLSAIFQAFTYVPGEANRISNSTRTGERSRLS